MVYMTCDVYSGSTGFCTLMRRENSDKRAVQTNKTNNEHKIDSFNSVPLNFKWCFSNKVFKLGHHWRQMLVLLQLLVSRKVVPKLHFPSFFFFSAIPDQAPTRLLSKRCSSMINFLSIVCVLF
jgi:hypothetical protein